jgi:23S rRNA (cytosine1962-C5)-methyltransferase
LKKEKRKSAARSRAANKTPSRPTRASSTPSRKSAVVVPPPPPSTTDDSTTVPVDVVIPATVTPVTAGNLPAVKLHPGEDRRIRRGHLWVFSNEVQEAPPELSPGDRVQFQTARGEFLGVGFYNAHSLIAGRLLDRRPETIDAAFIAQRLRRAMDLRRALFTDDAYRWVFGESDDLPGLVIDRYGDVCVIESYCAGMEVLRPLIQEALMTIHPWKAVILRNDMTARRLERLPEEVRLLHGKVDSPHRFTTEGLTIAADVLSGQKTGFFFDQRRNRAAVAALAKDRRVLDLFCHTGGFGLWAAAAGADSVLGVDESAHALALARVNAEENKLNDRMDFQTADIFDWLPKHEGKYDLVVLDPPRLASAKKNLPNAVEAYVRLNVLALRRLAAGGFLATASCSQHVDRETFRQILARAAYESGRRVRVIYQGGQGPDHPTRPSMPETDYLKFAIAHIT